MTRIVQTTEREHNPAQTLPAGVADTAVPASDVAHKAFTTESGTQEEGPFGD
jgi:hypothetical protein